MIIFNFDFLLPLVNLSHWDFVIYVNREPFINVIVFTEGMEECIIELREGKENLELIDFASIKNFAGSGGLCKRVITEGLVKLNGDIETRKRKKLSSGDVIEFDNKKYKVVIE